MAELAALAAAYPVAASVAGGVAGSVIGKMITPDTPTATAPAAPTVTPAPTMPTPGDANTDAAKRKSLADQLARRGRASTILTDNGVTDTLGG